MSEAVKQLHVKEKRVCEALAKDGHTIVHLDDTKRTDGSYDILLDGVKGDIKCLSNSNNILREGKKAVVIMKMKPSKD